MKTLLILAAVLASALPAAAVPRPVDDAEGPPEEGNPEWEFPEQADAGPKGIGFLGVSASPVPADRAEQLKLKHGVALDRVMPGTPAAEAGLRVGDIVTHVGDVRIDTMMDLSEAIQAHKEGDKVAIRAVQDGKEVEKNVTLAARPAPPAGMAQLGLGAQLGGGLRFNFGRMGVLRVGDREGSVEVSGRGEGREVVVRDHNDEVVFEGPWVTPQDKAATTPEMRQRIERVAGIFGDEPFVVPDFELPQIAPVVPRLERIEPPMLEKEAPDIPAPVDEEPPAPDEP